MKKILRIGDTPMCEVDYFPAYGLSTLCAGWAPVHGFRPERNFSGSLQATIAEIHCDASLNAADSGERVPPPIPVVEAELEGIQRPLSLQLRFESRGQEVGSAPISILPPWSWPLLPETRLHAATFVTPDEERVVEWVADLAVWESVASEQVPASALLSAAYETIASTDSFVYEAPSVQSEPWSSTTHQAIRSPAELLSGPGERVVLANCIDLSVLLASVLEARGMNPLLIFTGDDGYPPEHCLVGIWSLPGERFRPLHQDVADLVERAECGKLLIAEATGMCRGEHRLDFESALRRGVDQLRAGDSVQAVDVSASRPPAGECRSLVLVNAPTVARAFLQSRRLAADLGAKRREAVHLLHGLCAAEGELASWLLGRFHASPEEVISIIGDLLPKQEAKGRPVATRNHDTCVRAARANARNRGGSRVEEGDLLWAILENPSDTIRRVLEAAGCRLSRLQRELASRYDRPGETTTYRWVEQPPDQEPG